MDFKKTMKEILNLLPGVKKNNRTSPGVYEYETDTSQTGGTNQSEGYNASSNSFDDNDTGTLKDSKVVNI